MTNGSYKLLIEKPQYNLSTNYIQKNKESPSELYIEGPYMMASEKNKNNRIYDVNEMCNEVNRYKIESINNKSSIGELNHPMSPEVNLERACHIVTELRQDGNVFYGKSKVLTTPCGMLVRNLISDGVRVGVSSRALGQLSEDGSGVSRVSNMKLIAIDCVSDPSFPKAFVNGILESKEFIVTQDSNFEEVYNNFENSLNNIPRKDFDNYLREQVINFIKKISKKI